jgi:selenocysteine-specific elongation factor
VRFGERGLSLAGHGPKLSQNEQKLLAHLVETIRSAGMQPPTVKEFQQQVPKNPDAIPQLLALAAANGELVEIATDFYLHSDTDRQSRARLIERMAQGPGLTVSEIREILSTSRKYAVPYCEYLDRCHFTDRRGDVRVLSAESIRQRAERDPLLHDQNIPAKFNTET